MENVFQHGHPGAIGPKPGSEPGSFGAAGRALGPWAISSGGKCFSWAIAKTIQKENNFVSKWKERFSNNLLLFILYNIIYVNN